MAEWIGTTESTTTTSTISVSDIIKSARYDLQDYSGVKWNDAQLLNYVNRIIKILDDLLIAWCSDFTIHHATTTLSSGENTITPPDYTNNIVLLYIDSVTIIKKSMIDVAALYQCNKENSSTGKPSYWAHNNSNIYFNIESDDDYTLDAYYHIKTSTLALTDYLPYNDFFNEYIREAIVMMSTKTKDDKIINVDMQVYKLFQSIVDSIVVSRKHIPRVRLDF